MVRRGTVHDNIIELDDPLPFADGTRVAVDVAPAARHARGSPQAVLELAGTLTAEEAEEIMAGARACRQIGWSLWRDEP